MELKVDVNKSILIVIFFNFIELKGRKRQEMGVWKFLMVMANFQATRQKIMQAASPISYLFLPFNIFFLDAVKRTYN